MHPPTCKAGTRDPYHWLEDPQDWFRGPHQIGATGHWVGPRSKLLFACVVVVVVLVLVLVLVLVATDFFLVRPPWWELTARKHDLPPLF